MFNVQTVVQQILKEYSEKCIPINELMAKYTFKSNAEKQEFLMPLLAHNQWIVSGVSHQCKELMALTDRKNKGLVCRQETVDDVMVPSIPRESADDNLIIEDENIISCPDHSHLLMFLEDLKKRISPETDVKNILAYFKRQLKFANDYLLMSNDKEMQELSEQEIEKIELIISTISHFFMSKDRKSNTDKKSEGQLPKAQMYYVLNESGHANFYKDLVKIVPREYYDDYTYLLEFVRSGKALKCNDTTKCKKIGTVSGCNVYMAISYQSLLIFAVLAPNTYAILGALLRKAGRDAYSRDSYKILMSDFGKKVADIYQALDDSKKLVEQSTFGENIKSLLGGQSK